MAVQELAEEEVGEGEVRADAFEDSAAEEPAGCRRNQRLLSDRQQPCMLEWQATAMSTSGQGSG